MKLPTGAVIASLVVLAGCSRSESIGRTQADILAQYQTESARIVRYGGPSQGIDSDVGGFVGNPNQPINVSWKENGQEVKVEAEAEPGFYYQINRFSTPSGEFFWILIKLKNKDESSKSPEPATQAS